MNSISSISSYFNFACNIEQDILGITDDSRDVKNGYLFVARAGINSHGIKFIEDAISNGALCILSDQAKPNGVKIPFIFSKNLESLLIRFLFNFYGLKEDNFLVHGVTGTNGKTSTAFMAHQIIRKLKKSSCYIGTLGAILNDELISTKGNTTPGIFELFELLDTIPFNEETFIFLEVSSHALEQERLLSLPFHQTMLLNIKSDHLDYHRSLEQYIKAKLSIFNLHSASTPMAFIDSSLVASNLNTSEHKERIQFISAQDSSAPYYFKKKFTDNGSSTITFQLPNCIFSVEISLFPQFNLDNFACAIALISNSISKNELEAIEYSDITLPPGRSELLQLDRGHVFIDFAHDPDAMENILSALSQSYSDILLIFGCGGERDKEKRPKMMEVAENYAKKIIFTSDNNRGETFQRIVKDATGTSKFKNLTVIQSRQDAIMQGLASLTNQNILVILGKGHERTMEEGGNKIPFNDRECVLSSI
ncbi:UDP-N-acetylmuramoyl-L-alanyl-D-glutamate--2,6-diaminopimelate ligase [Gammaproteobacteria bacterium]|nr:UDP-N-acetylmuramoyl-L-alanyl-D-glutamate--2,6-diaminopimelate ligase [Gammaproteobacteria bacterium]MDB4183892.1 UDP-N-acetylmuramoyl-L-alanyl-D-glutamate--2,6-diaminopimelate ligase [Gammaproteobacteria bacterium]